MNGIVKGLIPNFPTNSPPKPAKNIVDKADISIIPTITCGIKKKFSSPPK
jgi:hypothetical protein